MKKFLVNNDSNNSKVSDTITTKIRLKNLIKKGTIISLVNTTLDPRWVDKNAYKRRVILDIKADFKVYFTVHEHETYWRHPAYYIHNEKVDLVKENANSYILTVTHGQHIYTYKIEV